MAMTDGILPVMDVAPDRGGDGFGGGGMWIFFLFILLLFRDGGFGGSSAAQGATLADLNNITNQINGISKGLCDGFYAQNTTMLTGFNGIDKGIAELGFNMQNCCCETNRNIDAVRYENAKNTCEIITAGERQTDRIIEKLTQSEIQNLRDSLNTANLQLSQQAQSANLIATLRPTPIPAYPSCSPYEVFGNRCGLV